MRPTPSSALRTGFLSAGLLVAALGFAQGKFTVNGRLKVEGANLDGARAVVYKDGVKERTITTNLSKFSLDLALNSSYVISFEREGYVAKKIAFNTQVPGEAVANGFTPFDFAVSLFKQYDDINIVVFNQPVGMIRYEPSVGDFDYDTDYTKSIQSQLQDVVAQVEKKQKLEQEQAQSQVKQQQEAARQQQRAEEEARKQAAAQQAADAKAKAEAERLAAEQRAAQARADAEAQRKAQADARAEEQRQLAARKEEEQRQLAARKEEERRKAAEAAAAAAKKPEPPAPAPVKERVPPPPPVPAPVRNTMASKPNGGEDARRSAAPIMNEEASPVAKAIPVEEKEQRPDPIIEEPIVTRTEDLVVDGGTVTTIVRLETDNKTTEYRRVYHKWGGVFYFKDGATCTQQVYDREALAPQLAGASPRGKMD